MSPLAPSAVARWRAATLTVLALLWTACGGDAPATSTDAASPAAVADGPTSVVFLVRHGETPPPPYEDDPPNPSLTREGRNRSIALARVLQDAELTHIHSTDLRRTRETGRVVARRTGLPIQTYDGRALDDFAARLRSTPGRHLILGHSNTTPALVAALGGDPAAPIEDRWEFDRLYVVTLGPGDTTTTLLRYGRVNAPPDDE